MKPTSRLPRLGAGRCFLLFAAYASTILVASAQQPYTVASIAVPTGFRHSIGAFVAPAGDVNLDGAPDLVAGFPYNKNEMSDALSDQPPFPNYPGSSGFYVWSPSTGAIVRTVVEPGNATRGFAAVNLGDINGDGKPDHAVSNPSANFVGQVDAYSGANGSILWTFVSGAPGSQAGVSLARITDVDLDGTPDLLVGAPAQTGIPGNVFVVSAQTGLTLRTHAGTSGDTLGYATSDAGDVDGDGVSDYAAGAPQGGMLGPTAPAGFVNIWSGATGALIRTVNGPLPADRFGRALAPAGDLNGDGVPDLYVGAPARFALAVPGRVYAISGANGSVLLNMTRNVPGDRFGWSLCAVGDRNGDGKTDCAAGTAMGVVEVRSGAFGGLIYTQTGILTQTTALNGIAMRPFALGDLDGDGVIDVGIGSPNAGENGLLTLFTSASPSASLAGDDATSSGALLGAAALGDLDGDGIRDLAIGNPLGNTPVFFNAGSVLVWSPGAGAPIGQLVGGGTQAEFGWSVSTLDDVDNDGIEDFLVSALGGTGGLPGTAGSVTCFAGGTGAPIYTTNGPIPLDGFGYVIARLSDLNGDGIRDFAVGAPYAAFGPGPTTGQVHICSGATGAILTTTTGLTAGEFLGARIAEIGDIDGDGVPDLVAGAPYGSPPGIPFAGFARVISGATGAIIRSHPGAGSGIACGGGVCGVGDADGDAIPDYAVASPANTASGPSTSGPVVVYSGATGAIITSIGPSPIPPGFSVNDTFGVGLSNAGDLDGDGKRDIVLGAFPSALSREVHAYSIATGTRISQQTASGGFTPFAPAPNTAGFDLTGDGAPDWVTIEFHTGPGPSSVRIMSRAGLPIGTTSVGAGCNLAPSLPPVLQTGGGALVAALGAPLFELLLSRAAPLQNGALVIGASNTTFNGMPLPLALGPFGLPGCSLYNSADLLFPFTATQDGLHGFPAPLPALPSLAGTTAYVQAFLVDSNGALVSATNGLSIVVQ